MIRYEMNLPPKDFTPQEHIIGKVLDDFGIRYDQGNFFMRYVVDFWIPDIGMVIEADGIYGHLKKRDVQRDMVLMQHPSIKYVLHVKETTYNTIKETLWQALNKLEDNQNPNKNPQDGERIDG